MKRWLGLWLIACAADSPPLPVSSQEAGAVSPPNSVTVPAPEVRRVGAHVALWFESGPGREALISRTRGDHAASIRALDRLLVESEAASPERAIAALLRGIEHREAREYAAATTRFEQARAHAVLAPMADRLRSLEAEAALKSGDPARAVALLDTLDSGAQIPESAWLTRGLALQRVGRAEDASAAFEKAGEMSGSVGSEARFQLGSKLVGGAAPQKARGLSLLREIALQSPESEVGRDADQTLRAALKGKTRRAYMLAHEVARVADLLERRDFRRVISTANTLLRKQRDSIAPSDSCAVQFDKGTAIFKLRERAGARASFQAAATICKRAGDVDRTVKSRYQAARGAYAAGKNLVAAREFESLAEEFALHSYADDAWILAGESWESGGEHGRAEAAYERALGHQPAGDMAPEALRRVVLLACSQGKNEAALSAIDRALKALRIEDDDRARLHYLRGRVLARLGREGAGDAYLAAIALRPLSYPALLALSRLRDLGEAEAREGLSLLQRPSPDPTPNMELEPGPLLTRVQLLASLGLGDWSRDELERAGLRGWPAVKALASAGQFTEAQRMLSDLGSGWRKSPPTGTWREVWKLAHPLVFDDLVLPRETTYEVAKMLTHAVMQTESRFDAGAVSIAGARGLIQMMPETAGSLAKSAGLVHFDIHQPETNLDLGMRYLGRLTKRTGGSGAAIPLAIASYNAGAGSVDRWLGERGSWPLDLFLESIPFDETRAYTQSVLGRWLIYSWLYGEDESIEALPYLPEGLPERS